MISNEGSLSTTRRHGDDRRREASVPGPSTPSLFAMKREAPGTDGVSSTRSAFLRSMKLRRLRRTRPRGESYLHRNASRRSVAETHHAQRSTGCPDEREKLPGPRAVRKRVGEPRRGCPEDIFSLSVIFSSFSSLSLSLSLCVLAGEWAKNSRVDTMGGEPTTRVFCDFRRQGRHNRPRASG